MPRRAIPAVAAVVVLGASVAGCASGLPSSPQPPSTTASRPAPAAVAASPVAEIRPTSTTAPPAAPTLLPKAAAARPLPRPKPKPVRTPTRSVSRLAAYATDVTVCNLVPAEMWQHYVPAAAARPAASGGISFCVAAAGSDDTFVSLTLQLSPVAKMSPFPAWVQTYENGTEGAELTPVPSLGGEAVSISNFQPNGLSTTEYVWRQDGYQLDLRLTSADPGAGFDLIDVAQGIYARG